MQFYKWLFLLLILVITSKLIEVITSKYYNYLVKEKKFEHRYAVEKSKLFAAFNVILICVGIISFSFLMNLKII